MTPTVVTLIAFLLAQLAIGAWVSRRIASEADYLIAGRRLGYALTTFSIFATWFGAETVVGSAGTSYRDGVSLGAAEPFGYGLCLALMGLVFARPLWRRRLTTLADLFRERFGTRIERLAAVILIPSSVLWAAAQVRAFGHVLTTATPALSGDFAIAVAAAVTLAYTAFGGMLVDAITDLLQGVILMVGLAILLAVVVSQLGGVEATVAAATAPGRIHLGLGAGVSLLDAIEEWAIPVCGSVVATELVGRVIAARSPEVARRSSFGAAGLYVLVGLIPVVIGLVGPRTVPALDDPERLVSAVALELLHPWVFAIFAAALVSAILSTVDSTLLVSSGLLSHNLLVPLFGLTGDRAKVRAARSGVIAFGVVAWLLAMRSQGVFELVEQASSFGSAGVLVTVCFGLFTGIGGARAAGASLVGGLATYLAASLGGFAWPFLASLAAALVAYLSLSVAERAPRVRVAEAAR